MEAACFLRVFFTSQRRCACVLSGYADRDQAVKVAGTAHQFLSKPCTLEAIEGMVQRARQASQRLTQGEVRRAVARISAVPCRPTILRQLDHELQAAQPDVEVVAALIASDIGMSAKIMQLVASSFFRSLRRRILSARCSRTAWCGVDRRFAERDGNLHAVSIRSRDPRYRLALRIVDTRGTAGSQRIARAR